METLSLIGSAFVGMMNPMFILLPIVGVAVGIVFDSIPGLSAAMAVALLLPVTFATQAREVFTLLVALYTDGILGGPTSAILINIPGTSSSIATYFDGSPMAKKGEAGKVLGTGVALSSPGGLSLLLVPMSAAPPVAQITSKFSVIEYFGACLFALSMIVALMGISMIKGLLSGCLGLIIALVGMASIDGTKRLIFGINELSFGFDILPTLVGILATAEVLAYAEEVKKMGGATQTKQSFKTKGFGFTWKEFVGQKWNALRSTLIGTGISILPGIGGSTVGILSWMIAKKTSKYSEEYGTGIVNSAVASKAPSSATVGDALIPLLTPGIPGDGVMATLLGAFMIHGLTPGPLLFMGSVDLIYITLIACILANVVMLALELGGMRIFVRLLNIPKYILLPVMLMLYTVGAFATNNRIFDVQSIAIFGAPGYLMSEFKLPATPFILSSILCDLLETNLRRGLMLTQNDFLAFFTHPITAMFMVAAALFVVWTVTKQMRNRKKETADAA